jgi:hypothetical protein
MLGKSSFWMIFASVVAATTLALGGITEAAVRKTNTLSNVSTQIIPNWNNSGSDVCFVHNSNNVPVSVVVKAFPSGTLVLGIDTWTFPVVLGAFGAARVFSWTPLTPASEYCKVMLVR